MKYTIAVDIDDVLNNLNDRVIQMFNEEYNASVTADMFTSYDIYKCLPFEEAENYTKFWLREDVWRSLSPIWHSQWGLKKLIEEGYNVVLATSTHYTNFAWKIEWLQEYFPFIDISKVICISDKGLLNVDIMIDDCAEKLISNIRCHRICLDKTWNRNIHDEAYGIHRCKDWDEIIKTVDRIYKEECGHS